MDIDTYDLMRKLVAAMNKIDGAYYVYGKSEEVNENMLAVLYELDDGKAHTQKQIAEDWLIPKTTVNTIVKELVSKGYVSVRPMARKKEIILTDSGREFAKRVLKDMYNAEQICFEK